MGVLGVGHWQRLGRGMQVGGNRGRSMPEVRGEMNLRVKNFSTMNAMDHEATGDTHTPEKMKKN
jgi:hypothetical protein